MGPELKARMLISHQLMLFGGENSIIDRCESEAAQLLSFSMQSRPVLIDLAINLHHCCIYTRGTFVCFSGVLTSWGGKMELNSSEMGVSRDNNAAGLEQTHAHLILVQIIKWLFSGD